MSKYGSDSVAFLLVDSFNLLVSDVVDVDGPEREALLERTDGVGKTWQEETPVGLRKATFGLNGFYDDADVGIVTALNGQQQTSRIVTVGKAGNVAGRPVEMLAGAFGGVVHRMSKRGELHKLNARFTVSGEVLDGVILQTLTAKTVDWNTEGAESVDSGASSAAGGVGVLHVTAMTGLTGNVVKIRHSADDVTYADLITFTNVTPWTPPAAAPAAAAQSVTVAGTVNRHLAVDGNVTGSGTTTLMVAFARK